MRSSIAAMLHGSYRRVARLGVALATLVVTAAAWAAPTLEQIRERRTVVFAYRDGAAPFSFRDRDGRVRGYSVELCERIAAAIQRQLGLADLKVRWLAVDADNRIET